MQNCTAAC